jgi:hypothetical protein
MMNGVKFECAVLEMGRALGIPVRRPVGGALPPREATPVLVPQAPYRVQGRTAGRDMAADLLVMFPSEADDVRIECRSQTSAGSADEKLDNLVNMAKRGPHRIVIIVLHGRGARPDIVALAREEAEAYTSATPDRHIRFMRTGGLRNCFARLVRAYGLTPKSPAPLTVSGGFGYDECIG